MKIFDEHGTQVDERVRPEPIEQEGAWYEAVEYRPAKNNELTLDESWQHYGEPVGFVRHVARDTQKPYWIMRLIPRASKDQLKAIGMKERDQKPVECNGEEGIVWDNNGECNRRSAFVKGKHRFVLVLVEKEAALKHCPFCGEGTLVMVTSLLDEFIGPQCQKCGANIKNSNKAKAVELWNNRYPLPPAPAVAKEDAHTDCTCIRCVRESGKNENEISYEMNHFIVCPRCGNKRCPHANDHRNACTDSNEASATAHTSCEGCKLIREKVEGICLTCLDWEKNSHEQVRKNYTPAPAPAPILTLDDCVRENPALASLLKTAEGEPCPKCGTPFIMTPICCHCGSIPILGDKAPAPAPKVDVKQELLNCMISMQQIAEIAEKSLALPRPSIDQQAPAVERGYTVEEILKAIDDEPELPGKMPEIMKTYSLEGALRAVVRATKRGIKERIAAVTDRNRKRG